MDRTGIIVVSLCVACLVGWGVLQYKQQKEAIQRQMLFDATNHVETAQAPTTNAAHANNGPTNNAHTANGNTATVPAQTADFDTSAPEQLLVLTNSSARYTFTSRGGGLKLVELLKYPETISARWRQQNQAETNGVASLNTHADVPVLAVLGGESLVGDGNYTLTRTATGVQAQKELPDGLVVTKDFSLSSNYLVNASVSFRNNSSKTLDLPEQDVVVGTATPMDIDDTSFITYGGTTWSDGHLYFDSPLSYFNTNTSILGIFPRKPTPDLLAGTNNVVWAAAHNQFFALIAMTPNNAPAKQVYAFPVTLPALAEAASNSNLPLPRGVQTELVYPAQTLTANSTLTRDLTIFAGPKEFRTLSEIAEQYKNRADLAMNFGTGYISFWGIGTFFAKLLLSGMNWLHDTTRMGYGWTIVVITILLRAAFWPFTAISLRSSKKMQALAPEIKALKEKYKDDPQKFTQKQMELWRKNGVNPMSGCFPMLVQMPVFFGFLAMIRCAIELRGAHFLWVADLTKPDTVFMIPGLNFPFNLLPLLMVGAMVWQAHLQPTSPGMDDSQQKMMRYMPLMFLLFFYNYSSGMALYMTISTLAGVVQTKLIRINAAPAAASPALTPAAKTKK